MSLATAERAAAPPRRTTPWPSWRTSHLPTAVAAITVGLVRWWTAHRREVVHMVPDEPGQLAIARFVGRGARWNMLDHSTWRPAFGTLISPATWFTDDPVAVYRAGLAVNAVLGAVSCVLLALLAARLTGRSRLVAAGMAALVSLSPALVFTTDWVWSEALVQTAFLLFVLAAVHFVDAGRTVWGLTMVVAAALGFATHSRLLPLAVSAVAVICVLTLRGRVRWPMAVGQVALLAALLVAVSRWSHWLVTRIWEDPAPTNTAGGVIRQFGDPPAMAASAVGQLWYQLVASVGVAGLGTIALVRAALRRRGGDRRGEPTAVDARVLLATVVPLVGLSIVFMTDRWRPDQIVYGRYNDVAMAPVVLVGLGILLVAGVRRLLIDGAIVVAAIGVLGVVLWALKDEELQARGLLRSMVLGVVGFLGRSRLEVIPVTITALLLAATVFVVALAVPRRPRTAVVGALAVALVVAGYVRTRPIIDTALNVWAAPSSLGDVAGTKLPRGAIVRDRIGRSEAASTAAQRQRLMLYQFYLPDNAVYLDGDTPAGSSTPYLFAPVDDVALQEEGAVILWRDPSVGVALWAERPPR